MTFVVFFGITLLLYGQTLKHAFIALDDPYVIVNNLSIRSITPDTIKHIFTTYDPELYTPLTFFTYQLSYAAGALNPAWYFIVNILLHALNATLVAGFIGLLLQSGFIGLLAGLFFAIHPMNTEVVAWATARKESLSAFFMLLSMISYVLYAIVRKKGMYGISIFSFVFALLSKVSVATLPALLFLIDFWERRPLTKKSLLEKLPYVVLSFIFIIIGIIPKASILESTTLSEKILMTAKSTMFYLQKFLVPLDLSVVYPNKNPISLQSPDFLLSFIAFLSFLAFIVWSLKKTRTIAFGFGFFLLAISPTFVHFNRNSNIQSGPSTGIQFASDHYMYVPIVGLLFVASALALRFWKSEYAARKKGRGRDMFLGCVCVVALIFSTLSFTQAAVWRNSETLFSHTLSLYPYSSAARVGLSVQYRKTGRFEEEERVLKEGLVYGKNSTLHAGLAAIRTRNGDFIGAETAYEEALRIDPTNARVHFGLGTMYAAQGKNDEAMRAYMKALSLDPLYPAAENNIGSLFVEQGNEDEARKHFLKAVEINPTFKEGHINLARIAITAKRYEEAIDHYKKAKVIELDPKEIMTHLELAQAYLLTGQNSAAFSEVKIVLEIDPEHAAAKAIVKEMVRLGILGNN